MWGAGQTRVPLPCRRRLAPTRPSVRFVSAAWLRRAIQRLASSAVRPLGGSLPRQSALEGLERCERRARATRNAGVCSPAGGVRRRRGRRRRAVPRASPIGSPSGRRGEEPLPERRSRRGPGARRRPSTNAQPRDARASVPAIARGRSALPIREIDSATEPRQLDLTLANRRRHRQATRDSDRRSSPIHQPETRSLSLAPGSGARSRTAGPGSGLRGTGGRTARLGSRLG